MPQIEIRFRSILSDENLSVLEGRHRARVNIEIGIYFLEGDGDISALEYPADRGDSNPLPHRAYYASGNEDVLCH